MGNDPVALANYVINEVDLTDAMDYDTRTHHSNMDVYDRLQTADMMKNAVIVASFVYEAANRDQMLPRKPLPKPLPPKK